MAKRFQLRRGNTAEVSNFTGAEGELVYNTETKSISIHDGVTKGGVPTFSPVDATTTVKGIVMLSSNLSGGSGTKAMTEAQGKVLSDQLLGVGQTYSDVTTSRVSGTTYTNTSTKPILCIVRVKWANGQKVTLYVDNVVVDEINTESNYPNPSSSSFIVPPNATYRYVGSIDKFTEMK